jgi:DNA-binding NarL/FixJ family response regulator
MTVAAHAADGNEASSNIVAHLTLRELEVLAYLPSGKTNREIAEALFISESTVKAHLTSLYAKLGVSNRTKAALVALGIFPILKSLSVTDGSGQTAARVFPSDARRDRR